MSATNAAVRILPRSLTLIPGGLDSAPRPERESKTFTFVVNALLISWLVSVAVSYAGLLAFGMQSTAALR